MDGSAFSQNHGLDPLRLITSLTLGKAFESRLATLAATSLSNSVPRALSNSSGAIQILDSPSPSVLGCSCSCWLFFLHTIHLPASSSSLQSMLLAAFWLADESPCTHVSSRAMESIGGLNSPTSIAAVSLRTDSSTHPRPPVSLNLWRRMDSGSTPIWVRIKSSMVGRAAGAAYSEDDGGACAA